MLIASDTEQTVQQVRQYDLFFDIDITGLSSTGKVSVNLETTGDIRLDAVGLQIKSVKRGEKTVPFKHDGKFLEVRTGKFNGPLDIDVPG